MSNHCKFRPKRHVAHVHFDLVFYNINVKKQNLPF